MKVSWMSQKSFLGVSKKIGGHFKEVLRSSEGISGEFKSGFKVVSSVFQKSFRGVSSVFQGR